MSRSAAVAKRVQYAALPYRLMGKSRTEVMLITSLGTRRWIIPKGNIEAGRAVGMSEALILRRITLPQVVRRMLPEGLNIFISLFKATTIVSLIAVPDLMYRVSLVTQQEMQPLPLSRQWRRAALRRRLS